MSTPAPSKSTIVRPKKSIQLTATRGAFRVLDKLAPGVAASWATKLWFTLPKGHGKRHDHRPRSGAISMVMLPRGRRAVVEAWGEGPTIYLVHGWGGWRGQLGAFVDPLANAGFRVVGFDVPSHGESPPGDMGKGMSSPDDAFSAVRAVADSYGQPAAVVAHSLGAITTITAVQDGLKPARLALIAPSPSPVTYSLQMADALSYGSRTRKILLERVEGLARRPLDDVEILTARERMPLPPTLIVHDRADKEVPHDESVRLADEWPTSTLVTTEGLGHQRILADSEVVKQVTSFMTTPD